jgi:hypothetical protein
MNLHPSRDAALEDATDRSGTGDVIPTDFSLEMGFHAMPPSLKVRGLTVARTASQMAPV